MQSDTATLAAICEMRVTWFHLSTTKVGSNEGFNKAALGKCTGSCSAALPHHAIKQAHWASIECAGTARSHRRVWCKTYQWWYYTEGQTTGVTLQRLSERICLFAVAIFVLLTYYCWIFLCLSCTLDCHSMSTDMLGSVLLDSGIDFATESATAFSWMFPYRRDHITPPCLQIEELLDRAAWAHGTSTNTINNSMLRPTRLQKLHFVILTYLYCSWLLINFITTIQNFSAMWTPVLSHGTNILLSNCYSRTWVSNQFS